MFILREGAKGTPFEQSTRGWSKRKKWNVMVMISEKKEVEYIGSVRGFSSKKLEAFSYYYPISHLRKQRSDVKEGGEEEPFQNKTIILDAPVPRAAAQGHGEKPPAEEAAGSKQGQQTGAAALRGVGQAGILPRAASCRAQMPQIYQHHRSASLPLKPKQLFVEGVLMEWGSRRELLAMSMLISCATTERNPESVHVFHCIFVFLWHKVEIILSTPFYKTSCG